MTENENESGVIDALDNSEVAQVEEQKSETEAAESAETQEQNNAEGEAKKKRPSGFHRKISRLEQENANLQAKLAELSTAKHGNEEPVIDNFENWNAYNDARLEWKIDQREKQKSLEAEKIEQQKAKEAANQTWQDRIDALPEQYDDYEGVVGRAFNGVHLNDAVIDALRESGPEVVFKIADDSELIDKIKKLSPAQAIKEIIKIESELSKPTVKVSKSPEPINPVRGSSRTTVNLAQLSADEHARLRYPHLFRK